jgi:hypothetical protein
MSYTDLEKKLLKQMVEKLTKTTQTPNMYCPSVSVKKTNIKIEEKNINLTELFELAHN